MASVLILTPAFVEWNPGYSLTSIVEDQAHMLERHGHTVRVAVSDAFLDKGGDLPYSILPMIPSLEGAVDYHAYENILKNKSHINVSDDFSRALVEHVREDEIIFSHDIIYTGWNLPYFHGLKNSGIKNRCYHWIHSIPTQQFDWWNLSSLGDNHRLVIPNRSHKQMTAEVFNTHFERVNYIPHIRDIRKFLAFSPEAWRFIDAFPKALSADIVQIYPASSDRLSAKGILDLIYLFREFKALGYSVCLVIVNQWATGRQSKEDLQEFLDTAADNRLIPQKEFVFTSLWEPPTWDTGLPQFLLRDLMSLGNVFIFPTKAESFGLVLPEALLASGALPVVNSHLEVMSEITQGRGMRFGFGSWTNGLAKPHSASWYESVASSIAQRIRDEEAVAARSIIRQTYNMDSIYKDYYLPLLRQEVE